MALDKSELSEIWRDNIRNTEPQTNKVEVQVQRVYQARHDELMKAGLIPEWNKSMCQSGCVHI